MAEPGWINADWPAPSRVRAGCTTRLGGASQGTYAGFNLARHVGDDSAAVSANRRALVDFLSLPAEPRWLTQVHGCAVCQDEHVPDAADACLSRQAGVVCAVMTADCLPVLMCDRAGGVIAAVHAGWRGLAAGILGKTAAMLNVPAPEVLVWFGPAIGPEAFEVGEEVRAQFVARDVEYRSAFTAAGPDKWLMDIYATARIELAQQGIQAIYGGGWCTYRDAGRFYSYRRDGVTGRMASLIWRGA